MISSAESAAPGRVAGLRVLFTASAWPAQVFPAAALGWAFQAAGHDVLVAGEPSLGRVIAETGLPVTAIGRDPERPATSAMPEQLREQHLRHTEATVDDLVRLASRWRPDLIVHGPASFAAAVAGAVLGVPTVGHLDAGPAVPRMEPQADTGPLWLRYLRLVERFGVEPGLEPALWVDPCPPSMALPAGVVRRPVRFVPSPGPGVVPAWLLDPPTRARVCVPWWVDRDDDDDQDTLAQVMAGLTTLDAEIVLTAGPTGRRPGLNPLLDEALAAVRVVDSIALPTLLRTCDTVVHQGWPSTTLTVAACAAPQLIVGRGPEQVLSGDRLAASGAGRLLPADELPPGECGADIVGSEAAKLLDRPAYGVCARRLRAEIERQPTPAELVSTLTRLVTDLPASTPDCVSV